jgi:hypothetical protein
MNEELIQAEKEAQEVIKLARELFIQGFDVEEAFSAAENFLETAEGFRLSRVKGAL